MPCLTLATGADHDGPPTAAPTTATEHRGQLQIVFPPDERTRVTPTTSSPWSSLGQLVMLFPNGRTYSGTGVVIDDHHVLTAAHNVFGNDIGGLARRCVFLPARDGTTLHGAIDVDRVCLTEEYRSLSPADPDSLPEGEVDYTQYTEDYAVVRLTQAVGSPAVPLLAASDDRLDRTTVTVAGYPGDKQPPDTLWTSTGSLGVPDDEFLFYRIDTYRGQSGSPVLLPRTDGSAAVVGVHVAGDVRLGTNFAVRLTPDRVALIRAWAAV